MTTLLDVDTAVDAAATSLSSAIAARTAFVNAANITPSARNSLMNPIVIQSALLFAGIDERTLGIHLSGSARRLRSVASADGVA